MTINECYFTLGIDEYASIHDIKNAYRSKVLAFHPDKNPAISNDTFIKIQEAFKTLVLFKKTNSNEYNSDLVSIYAKRAQYERIYKTKVKQYIKKDKEKRRLKKERSSLLEFGISFLLISLIITFIVRQILTLIK